MEGVVYNHAVQKAKVLNHGTATDVKLSALVAGGVDSREYLEVLGKVGGAADGGHLLDLRGSDFLDRDLRLYFTFLDAAVGHDDGLEGFGLGAQ